MKRMTLKAARCRKALTQRELAEQAGVGYKAITYTERGVTRPRLSTIRLLSAALGVEPEAIAWPGNPMDLSEEEDAA